MRVAIDSGAASRHTARARATYARFLRDVVSAGGYTLDQAADYTVAVIATVEERLTLREVQNLEAQLPTLLEEELITEPILDLPTMTAAEFEGRVAARSGITREEARAAARTVLSVLRAHVSPGESRLLGANLPPELTRHS